MKNKLHRGIIRGLLFSIPLWALLLYPFIGHGQVNKSGGDAVSESAEIPQLSDSERAGLAILQRDLADTAAELNGIQAQYNAVHEQLTVNRAKVNARVAQLNREGFSFDPERMIYTKK